MSLLWADAAAQQLARRTAGWWNGQKDFEYEGEGEYSLRDPAESAAARRERHISQIVDRHNVSRKRAARALRTVSGHLGGNDGGQPTDYGFASNGSFSREHFTPGTYQKLADRRTWAGRPVVQVPTDEIHASQHFIRHESVAHNLFWPGHREPEDYEATGDPDWEPESEHEREDLEHETPEERELHRTAKFLVRRNGRVECVDGHHRVGADILLGKKTTPGQVIHEHELSGTTSPAIRQLPWIQKRDELHEHLRSEHGFSQDLLDTFGPASGFGSPAGRAHDQDHMNYQDDLDHEHDELCLRLQASSTARSPSSGSAPILTG